MAGTLEHLLRAISGGDEADTLEQAPAIPRNLDTLDDADAPNPLESLVEPSGAGGE